MQPRICEFVSEQLETSFSCNLKHVVLIIVFVIRLDLLTCSECIDSHVCRSSVANKNQNSTPPILPKLVPHMQLAALATQDYDAENTGEKIFTENYKLISHHQDAVMNKDNSLENPTVNEDKEYSPGFSTSHNPIMKEETNFSEEFYTAYNPIVYDGYESSSRFSATQNPTANGNTELSPEVSSSHNHIMNGDTEILTEFFTINNPVVNDGYESSEFSTVQDSNSSKFSIIQTVNHTNKSQLSGEPAEVNESHESQLTSDALNRTPYSVKEEIKYSYLNTTSRNLIGDSPNYISYITDNLINLAGENNQCKGDDLSVSFECLKEKLLQDITNLMSQKALSLSDTVRLIRIPVPERRALQRCLGCSLWGSIATFFRSRVLKVTVPAVAGSTLPAFVTTARIVQGRDNDNRFEVGLEFPQNSAVTDVAEARGAKKKKMKKFKKALMFAIMAKAAVIAKAALGGAVILAKKALLVAILSLAMSSIAASKKKTAPKATTGDHKYRRFGTVNYFDLKPDYPEHGNKYIDPLSHKKLWQTSNQYHDQSYPNFTSDKDDLYADESIENSSFDMQSQTPSYSNEFKSYSARNNWPGLARPRKHPIKPKD